MVERKQLMGAAGKNESMADGIDRGIQIVPIAIDVTAVVYTQTNSVRRAGYVVLLVRTAGVDEAMNRRFIKPERSHDCARIIDRAGVGKERTGKHQVSEFPVLGQQPTMFKIGIGRSPDAHCIAPV